MLGVGKAEQDTEMLDETAARRRLLESELEETEELRLRREAKAAKEESIRRDVTDILRPFFCEICQKQYKMASEFEAHLSSYDHHHKKVRRRSCSLVGARPLASPVQVHTPAVGVAKRSGCAR